MKSMIACLLASLMIGSSLLPGFGVEQSTKLVELIQHYQQHVKDAPELGFVEFMVMHYGADSEHQKNPNHSHHNLPSAGHVVSVYAPITVRFGILAHNSIVLLSQTAFSRYTNLYSFQAVFSLINPPRR